MGYISSIIKAVESLKNKILSGQVLPTAQNPSGKFLKDDGTWAEAGGGTGHSHSNLTVLNGVQESLTTLLKSTYDGYASGKQDTLGFTPANVNHLHGGVYEPANTNIQTHVTSVHAPSNAQKNSDITKAEIEAKLTGPISTHSHAGGSDPWTVKKLTGDFTTSLTANTNVTGFNFAPASNKTYLIYGTFLLRTATATVGTRPGIAWPTGLADGTARMEASTSLTASVIRSWGAINTQNATSTGLADTANSHFAGLEALIVCGGSMSGNFQITLASETAGTNVTMKAGSYFMYREI